MAGIRKRAYDAVRLNFAIFPGVTEPRAADFLLPYYRWVAARQGAGRKAFNALVWAIWQVYVPIRARKMARFWQRDDAWRRQAVIWGRKHFVDPGDIAAHENGSEADFRLYHRRFEQIRVIRAIESAATDHAEAMTDKAQFQAHCETLGLPVPRLLARVTDGKVEQLADWHEGQRVLAKPVRGSGGIGIVAETPADDFDYGLFLRTLGDGEWLVQDAARVHPELADIALDALPTARIVTIRNEAGAPEIVTASIRLAVTPGVPVDNNHRGGLSALIDMGTGTLGHPIEIEGPARHERHPATGKDVAGRVVPDWEAAKALAIEAHARAFPEHVLIGWDIGFSDRGPILIEANQRPNVRLTQRIEGKGIGEMRYGELLAFHLQQHMERGADGRKRFLVKS